MKSIRVHIIIIKINKIIFKGSGKTGKVKIIYFDGSHSCFIRSSPVNIIHHDTFQDIGKLNIGYFLP